MKGVERQAIEGLANCPYRADALKVLVNLKNTHVPVMFWRSVGSSQNAFAVESFIDELAFAAKRDPLEYRRSLLMDRPDFIAVLDALADKGDWGKPLPKGVGRGLAIHESFGTIVGEIAEVAVSGQRRDQGRAGGRLRRLRPSGQSADRGDADRERRALRADRRAVRRDHHSPRAASSRAISILTRSPG